MLTEENTKESKSRFKILLISGIFGLSIGIGLGAALRASGIQAPGAKVLQREQSFPQRDGWPITTDN